MAVNRAQLAEAPATAAGPAPVAFDDARHLLLDRAHAERARFELRFPHDDEVYRTSILELVPAQGYIVIDGLLPVRGNERLPAAEAIEVNGSVGAIDIRFRVLVVARGGATEAPYFKAYYPDSIDYPQRRSEYRVTVPMSRRIEARLSDEDGAELIGEVRDLSASGFAATLREDAGDTLARFGTRTLDCVVSIDADTRIEARAVIRHVFPARGSRGPRIGVCFVDLAPRAERALEGHVARLDRERARLR